MCQLKKKARRMAVARFEQLVGRTDFARMEENALASLLDGGGLGVRSKEAVWGRRRVG
jgi:hypothetical protein